MTRFRVFILSLVSLALVGCYSLGYTQYQIHDCDVDRLLEFTSDFAAENNMDDVTNTVRIEDLLRFYEAYEGEVTVLSVRQPSPDTVLVDLHFSTVGLAGDNYRNLKAKLDTLIPGGSFGEVTVVEHWGEVIHYSYERREEVSSPFEHSPTGVVFPGSLGSFQRVGITEHEQDGRLLGVLYQTRTPGPRVQVEVHIRPAEAMAPSTQVDQIVAPAKATDSHFRAIKDEILEAHAGLFLVGEDTAVLEQPRFYYEGRMAKFSERNHSVYWGDDVRFLYVFSDNTAEWVVDYLFTFSYGPETREAMEVFLESFQWNLGGP